MTLIRNYLLRQLTGITFFTLAAFLGLYSFFDIISESSNLGKAKYNLWRMLLYVTMQIPSHAYELMPLAVLIGCMITMIQLTNHSEYTVIRTSGISIAQIAKILVQFGLLFTLVSMLLGEFAAPYLQTKAEKVRLEAMQSVVAKNFRSGVWLKDSNHLINVTELLPNNRLIGIKIYTYDNNYRLIQSRIAQRGRFLRNGYWELENVFDSNISTDKIVTQFSPIVKWPTIIDSNILRVLLIEPQHMSAYGLINYIQHLRVNQQTTQTYEVALWGRLFYPLACVSMALISLAFVPRQRRHGQLGKNMFLGICLGVGFHFANRLFGFLSMRYDWSPLLSAMLPTVLLLIAGVVVISWQEKQ